MSEHVEYAIVWDEHVSGLDDMSRPFAFREDAERKLAESAFDGRLVQRTVVFSEWTPA